MTKREAASIIGRILANEIVLELYRHVRQRLVDRTYSPHDIRAVTIMRMHRPEGK